MSRRPLRKFLISGNALQAHLLCGGLIIILSLSFWNENAKPGDGWGLVAAIIVYPILLLLLWTTERALEQAAVEHSIESITAPEQLRRKRRMWRRGSLAFIAALAAALHYSGEQGLRMNLLPAQYCGYFLYAVVALGVCRVNIWHSGPLDPRFDPHPTDAERQVHNVD